MLTHFGALLRRNPAAVLIVPDTHYLQESFDQFVLGEQAWAAYADEHPQETPKASRKPDPLDYASAVPVQAEFKITGLIQEGAWQDPSDLEAARALLQYRYDLTIGIWDLASNPTLRATLLDVVEVRPAPPIEVAVPAAANARAKSKLDKEQATWEEWAARLNPLTQIGVGAAPWWWRLVLPFPLRAGARAARSATPVALAVEDASDSPAPVRAPGGVPERGTAALLGRPSAGLRWDRYPDRHRPRSHDPGDLAGPGRDSSQRHRLGGSWPIHRSVHAKMAGRFRRSCLRVPADRCRPADGAHAQSRPGQLQPGSSLNIFDLAEELGSDPLLTGMFLWTMHHNMDDDGAKLITNA